MLRPLPRRLPLLLAGLVLCLPVHGQDQPSLGDAARQAKAAKSAQSKKAAKVITNDDLSAAKVTGAEGPELSSFLRRIAGRWNFAYVRKGNSRWWPDHGLARPNNQIHYLCGRKELLIESRPEFGLPSITDRFVYGSVRKISAELFDVELLKSGEPAREIKRFRLSPDGKTLEIATDAERSSEPSIQVLELVDANWSDGGNRQP